MTACVAYFRQTRIWLMRKTPFAVAVLCFALMASANSQDKATVRPESNPKTPTSPNTARIETLGTPPLLPTGEDEADFTISKQVHEVNLFLSVTDEKGRFVSDLAADELKVLDNHKSPERLTYFQARTNLPLRVILAIDVSTSIRERLHFEQEAASAFLKHIMRTEMDEAAIVAFASTVQEKTQGMTNDVNALDATIRTLQAYGETAMYDAIVLSCRKLHGARRTGVVRPIIILITDGVDTASKETLQAAEESATRVEAAIFALDASSIYETDQKGRLVLEKLTHETGGIVLPARETGDLKGAFKTIEKILRNQYALGYPPPGLEADGSFRPIEVASSRRGLRVHARHGYYAPKK